MPERFVFIHPATLLSIFREVAGDDDRLIFRRFTPSGHEAAQHVVDLDDRAAQRYIEGGYSIMYLTLGAIPEHPQDWGFFERASREMISVDGCRVRDDILELASMRTVTRISEAERLFQRIDRRIKKICRQGMRVFDWHVVNTTKWYDPNVLSMKLRSSLDSPEYTWVPVSEEQVKAARTHKKG